MPRKKPPAPPLPRAEKCYSPQAAGQIIGLNHASVRKLVDSGQLKAFVHRPRGASRTIRIPESALRDYLARCTIPVTAAVEPTPAA